MLVSFDVRAGMKVVYLTAPVIGFFYFLFLKKKSLYFNIFMICCMVANFLSYWDYSVIFGIYLRSFIVERHNYLITNSLLAVGYISLIYLISSKISFKLIWKNFKLPLFVLTALGTYIIYVFVNSVRIADFTMFLFDLIYNLSLLILFTLALINFLYWNDKKSFYFFLGCLLIVFQDVLGIVYAYLSREMIYALIWISFSLGSYYFFLMQTNMKSKKRSAYPEEEEEY
ncbi:hypothetical protein GCM10022260_28180 [Gaetbulibacter aestuarii]